MYSIIESHGLLEFSTCMSSKARLIFMAAGLLPLLIPYKLFQKTSWSVLNVGLVLSLLASLVALAGSVALFMAGLLGTNERIRFDAVNKIITHGVETVISSYREATYSFTDIEQLTVKSHDWSDGPSTYDIQMLTTKGQSIEFGDFASRTEADRYRGIIQSMLL